MFRKKRYIIKGPSSIKALVRSVKVTAFVIAAVIYLGVSSLPFSKATETEDQHYFDVVRVIDGDTIVLSDGQKVRLIGIDTPEVHYSKKLLKDSEKSRKSIQSIQAMGREASEFTKELCLGKRVRLINDVEKRDHYGRTLAYVYIEDGTFLNAKILEEGYARVMTIPPNVKYADYFLKLQKEARKNGKGFWSIKNE